MLSRDRFLMPVPREYRIVEAGSFTVSRKGRDVGVLHFTSHSGPIPHIYVSNLEVEVEFQGKGIGSQLMKEVEKYIKNKKVPGILIDATYLDDPAHGMYERRGWKPLCISQAFGMLSFNQCGYTDEELWKAYTEDED